MPEPDTAVAVDDVIVGIISAAAQDCVQLDINPQHQALVDKVVKALNVAPEGLPTEIPHA